MLQDAAGAKRHLILGLVPKSVVKRQEVPGKSESRIGEEFRLRRGFADAVAVAECEEVSAGAESAAGFEEAGREASGDLCEAGFAVVMLVILEASSSLGGAVGGFACAHRVGRGEVERRVWGWV